MMPEQGTVAQFAAAVRKLVRGAGAPTTWTIIQQDGPNHLGLWCNMLPEYQMAAITSGCVRSGAELSDNNITLPADAVERIMALYPPQVLCTQRDEIEVQ